METHGPLGVIWVSIGLGCFYIALIWINSLLGLMITPLFTLLATRGVDAWRAFRGRRSAAT